MLSYLHLNSFKLYNLLLIIIFSLLVNSNNGLDFINICLYSIYHFLIIYLGIYYYKKILFLIFFIYGLLTDIFLLNEIGPHLIIFLIFLLFISFVKKFLENLSSFKIYILILILHIIIISLENLISYIIFDYNIQLSYFVEIIIISLILSFPIFIFFSKIDRIN